MDGTSSVIVAACGLLIGGLAGFFVRRARLCTFGALEDAMIGRDTRRLKVLAIALGIALLGTQLLIVLGEFDPGETPYVPPAWPWLGAALGGALFGLGMALVGTCAFGSLVRLGCGDLRSLIVLLVFGLVAYATQRGAATFVRTHFLDPAAIALPSLRQGDLPTLVDSLIVPIVPMGARALIAVLAAAALGLWALRDSRLLRSPRLVTAGIVLGLCIVAGWVSTAIVADPLEIRIYPQSLNFVAPVGRAIYSLLLNPADLVEFGIASAVGAMIGATIAGWSMRELRWEAFDDQREMRRHLLGAVLMGFGGVCAGGCTIGQGLTAASMLSLGAPLAIGGMAVGARIGIFLLVDGADRPALLRALSFGSRTRR